MKNILTLVFLGILALSACKKNLIEINTNVNAPIDVEPEFLLRQVIYNVGENMSYEGFVAGNLLSQHFAMVDFNLFDRHNLNQPQLGGNPWPILYKNLRDNQIILNKAINEPIYSVYEGPARIMKALIAQQLTDLYGDVPYSEALKGLSGNVTPAYDSQQTIYLGSEGIINQLDKAISAIDAYTAPQKLTGDILFSGNLEKWKRFASSLKIKALMRISDRASEINLNISQELQTIVSDGNFITSNSDNAVFQFSASQPNSFRMQQLRIGDFNLYVMAYTADSILQTLNDPRKNTLFRPTSANISIYEGLRNGIDNSQTTISLANYSLSGTVFRENTGSLKANFMTAWETQFLLAEAAEKGLITGSALSYYNDAVTNAFDYWNVALPPDYLSSGPAQFGTGNPIEQIITQKWIANCINGYESWIEYSRTGFPILLPVLASLNGGQYPVRMPYPSDESALNFNNYSLSASSTGGNSVNSKVWWDKF